MVNATDDEITAIARELQRRDLYQPRGYVLNWPAYLLIARETVERESKPGGKYAREGEHPGSWGNDVCR